MAKAPAAKIHLPVHQDPRTLLEEHADPAILLSPSYQIVAANAAYEAHYGRSVRAGDHCYRVSHGYDSPCDQNGETCPLVESRDRGRRTRVFHVHDSPMGQEHVDVSITPVFGADGIEGYVEVIRPIPEASARAGGIFLGRSEVFTRVVELIQRVAPSEVPALLLGESGTGKELAARAIHEASARAAGPFVPVECSSLTESLFESELFGHHKGAFTGAHKDKRGLVEAATGGTLFLDEIGDVPLHLQVKLLRLLESGLFRRVGDATPHEADFRLICATNHDLEAGMAAGRFREDLYYRISAFPIRMPPLRERGKDVDLLAQAILADQGPDKRLSAGALELLRAYPFPGNVRELRNILERATLLCDEAVIELEHLPARVRRGGRPAPGRPPAAPSWPWGEAIVPLAEVVDRYVRWASDRFAGERSGLAEALGISERTLYRRMRASRRGDGAGAGEP
ncbi:MAG: sigma 54-interacting transcriptional regulator [Nannocystaceae bacterium]